MDGMPELHLVTTIYRATNAIVRELDRRLLRDYDVTFVQALTLLAIQSFDQPQPRLVAEFLSQQSQTVTGVLDRLERAGHIRRSRDLADRRGVRLELTGTGSRLAAALRERLSGYMAELFQSIPIHAGASGLSILAFLDPALRDRIVRAPGGLVRFTDATLTTAEQLESAIADIRSKGYAITRGQRAPGAVGIAAPFWGEDATVMGTVMVTIPEQRFDPGLESELSSAVLRAASTMTALVGGRAPLRF